MVRSGLGSCPSLAGGQLTIRAWYRVSAGVGGLLTDPVRYGILALAVSGVMFEFISASLLRRVGVHALAAVRGAKRGRRQRRRLTGLPRERLA